MVKDWEAYKDEIEELYIQRDNTLGEVMKIMLCKYGFKASERAYKMKLDDWSMKKYKSRQKGQHHHHTHHRRRQQNDETASSVSVSDTMSNDSLSTLPTQHHPARSVPVREPPAYHTSATSQEPSPPPPKTAANPTWNDGASQAPTPSEPFPSRPLGPVVNSSLMFFSDRAASESLAMLASFPGMAPRALETLLRNWRSGGLHMDYALAFLQRPECCHTIVGVNWTRWTDRDETLFDLLEDIPSTTERTLLARQLLTADLRWGMRLRGRCADWAGAWREACAQREWAGVRQLLVKMAASRLVRTAAFEVLAEELLRKMRTRIEFWANTSGGEQPLDDCRREYLAIVASCQQRDIEVGSEWYRRKLDLPE